MIKRISQSLAIKLTLVIIFVGLIGVGTVALFTQQATSRQFKRFVVRQEREGFIGRANAYYQQYQTWDGYIQVLPPPPSPARDGGNQNREQRHEKQPDGGSERGNPPKNLPRQPPPPRGDLPPPPHFPNTGNPPRALFALLDVDNCLILPMANYRVGDCLDPSTLDDVEPILIDDVQVGSVVTVNSSPEFSGVERIYITAINTAIRNAMIVATLLALILGLLWARYLTRPLKELTNAIHAMTGGELKQEVTIRSKDELGQLAGAFNQMSADVSHANLLRRQMTADVAHDLRNPLGVLSGYIEAMRDGVLKPTDSRLGTMQEEVHHLEHLVDDLWTLARADAGELQLNVVSTHPLELLERTAAAYAEQANSKQIQLEVDANEEVSHVAVDPERMIQVMGNLVSNALRHTPVDGQVHLTASTHNGTVELGIRDTGSGIEPDAVPYIFERFYRADSAREQNNGESGLGLAIAKMIVEAHDGEINVESEPGKGTVFRIGLPVQSGGGG